MTTVIKSQLSIIVASVAATIACSGAALGQGTTNVEEKSPAVPQTPAQFAVETATRNEHLDTLVDRCIIGEGPNYLEELQQVGFDFRGQTPNPSEICLEAFRAVADRSTVTTDTTPLADREIMEHYKDILLNSSTLFRYEGQISPQFLHLSIYKMSIENNPAVDIHTATGTLTYIVPESRRAGEAVLAGYVERRLHPDTRMPDDIVAFDTDNAGVVGQIVAGCLMGLPPMSVGEQPYYHLCLVSGYIQGERDNLNRTPFYQSVPPLPGTP